jgi:hypothetical protein
MELVDLPYPFPILLLFFPRFLDPKTLLLHPDAYATMLNDLLLQLLIMDLFILLAKLYCFSELNSKEILYYFINLN